MSGNAKEFHFVEAKDMQSLKQEINQLKQDLSESKKMMKEIINYVQNVKNYGHLKPWLSKQEALNLLPDYYNNYHLNKQIERGVIRFKKDDKLIMYCKDDIVNLPQRIKEWEENGAIKP